MEVHTQRRSFDHRRERVSLAYDKFWLSGINDLDTCSTKLRVNLSGDEEITRDVQGLHDFWTYSKINDTAT